MPHQLNRDDENEALIERIIVTAAPGLAAAAEVFAKAGRDPRSYALVITRPPEGLNTQRGVPSMMILDIPLEDVPELARKAEEQIPKEGDDQILPTAMWQSALTREMEEDGQFVVITMDNIFAVAGISRAELYRLSDHVKKQHGSPEFNSISTNMGEMMTMTVKADAPTIRDRSAEPRPKPKAGTITLQEAAKNGVTKLTRMGWSHNQYLEIRIANGLIEPKADVVVLDDDGIELSRHTMMTLVIADEGYVPWTPKS